MSQNDLQDGATVKIVAERRASGAIILRNEAALPDTVHTLPARLAHWAAHKPDQLFMSEFKTASSVSYRVAEQRRATVAAHLLAFDISLERPLLIIGENGLDHALMLLAANSVGLPVAVISPSYASARAAPWDKFRSILATVTPGLVLADDVGGVQDAAGGAVAVKSLRDWTWLNEVEPVADERRQTAEQAVDQNSIAKLLFTSGSTGTPKAVIQTQGMMGWNMEGLAAAWPFLSQRAPVLVDWLPWNHVFGGNFCFNIALYFGGTLHVDCGKPVPGLIDHTIAALRQVTPTAYFNVPMGYEMLLSVLENDQELAHEFFGSVDCLFNAGAAMPASVRARIEVAALAAVGKVPPIYGGWGSTETAPLSTIVYFPTPHAANLGVPVAGTSIKMVPDSGKWELRVKGPNVTPGYWRDPAATQAAFDDEGYFLIGDAGRFADPDDFSAGILFDGRMAENFKLSSGTWVNVDTLRLAIVSSSDGLIADAVIVGEGRDEIGALLFLSEAGAKAGQAAVLEKIANYNSAQQGSSTRLTRVLVLDQAPDPANGEITEKGSLNQRRILNLRTDDVARLYQMRSELAG